MRAPTRPRAAARVSGKCHARARHVQRAGRSALRDAGVPRGRGRRHAYSAAIRETATTATATTRRSAVSGFRFAARRRWGLSPHASNSTGSRPAKDRIRGGDRGDDRINQETRPAAYPGPRRKRGGMTASKPRSRILLVRILRRVRRDDRRPRRRRAGRHGRRRRSCSGPAPSDFKYTDVEAMADGSIAVSFIDGAARSGRAGAHGEAAPPQIGTRRRVRRLRLDRRHPGAGRTSRMKAIFEASYGRSPTSRCGRIIPLEKSIDHGREVTLPFYKTVR